MKYCVYKTTNLVNGNFYIGKHNVNPTNNKPYYGSGKLLKQALKKYGKKNFVVEILKEFSSEEEAYAYERILVSEILEDLNSYNLVDGGSGFTQKSAKLANTKAKEKGYYGFANYEKEKLLNLTKEAGKLGAEVCRKNGTGMFCMTFEERSGYSKKNNSNRVWITNGSENRRIDKSVVLPEGFRIGRSNLPKNNKRKNVPCWTNGRENIFSTNSPGNDYELGMTKKTPTAKMPWWNNGIIGKRSYDCPGEGFSKGRLKRKSTLVKCDHCSVVGGAAAMGRHHFSNCKHRKN